MEALLKSLDLEETLLLDEFIAWMDGGSVTLKLVDSRRQTFCVEFVQRVSLKKHSFTHIPGSLLFENEEVPIRSTAERLLLKALRQVHFKDTLPLAEQQSTRRWIQECVEFVESDEYLRIAVLMGRLQS